MVFEFVVFVFCFAFLQIATQISVLIAKVARVDCPRQWPELIPTLLESVKVQDDLRQHRALLTFYHVTKTLASKRLAADRKLFYDVSNVMQCCRACKPCIVLHACHFPWLAGSALMAGAVTLVSAFETEVLLVWWVYVQYEITGSQFLGEMFLRSLIILHTAWVLL